MASKKEIIDYIEEKLTLEIRRYLAAPMDNDSELQHGVCILMDIANIAGIDVDNLWDNASKEFMKGVK